MKQRAFSVVELLVAISVLAILAAVITITFTNTRRNSRDARRKADVQTINSAVTQYQATNGTSFVTFGACSIPSGMEQDPTVLATGVGCTGAGGRSYGKVNLKSATTDGYVATTEPRTYAAMSILEALVRGQYLTLAPRDPLASTATGTDPLARDYVLIRACIASGQQQVGSRGTALAVWAALEGAPTTDERVNSLKLPGGEFAGPEQPSGSPAYVYDFAAQNAEWLNGDFWLRGYAAGNSVTKVTSSEDCAPRA
jgi:prepilin-type N-terminal cleavage/methylation domain-containing protein